MRSLLSTYTELYGEDIRVPSVDDRWNLMGLDAAGIPAEGSIFEEQQPAPTYFEKPRKGRLDRVLHAILDKDSRYKRLLNDGTKAYETRIKVRIADDKAD